MIVRCEERSVQCAVKSLKMLEVWMCGDVWRVKCETESVKFGLWSADWRVRGVEWGV